MPIEGAIHLRSQSIPLNTKGHGPWQIGSRHACKRQNHDLEEVKMFTCYKFLDSCLRFIDYASHSCGTGLIWQSVKLIYRSSAAFSVARRIGVRL